MCVCVCVCVCVCERVTQSCPTLSDPVDCSPLGSSVHGVIQARIPEWVAFPSPGDLPDSGTEPRSPALQADSLLSEPPGNSWWDSNLGPNRGLHGQILCCVTFTRMNTCVSCDPQETQERAGFAPFCRKMRKLARPRASGCAGSQGRSGSVPSASAGGPCCCIHSSARCPHSAQGSGCIQGAVRCRWVSTGPSRDDGGRLQPSPRPWEGGRGALRRSGVLQAGNLSVSPVAPVCGQDTAPPR